MSAIREPESVYLVITNNGDGSNSIEFYCDPSNITYLSGLARQGCEKYASGDGLQVTELLVPDLLAFAEMQGPSFHWSDEFISEQETY